ncbi:MAG: ATP-binding protein, partial [Bacteroidota bacterium]
HKMDRAKGIFERYTYDPAHPDKLSRPPVKKIYEYADDHITFINEDVSGSLWIGTLEGGINRYNPQTEKITHYGSDTLTGNSKTFKENGAWQVFTSRDGIIWISAWQESLYRVDPFSIQIPHHELTGTQAISFSSVGDSIFFIGTPNGLIRQNKRQGISAYLISDSANPSTISSNEIQCITKDSDGVLWIGTSNGLNKYDDRTKTFTRFHHDDKNKHSLPFEYVLKIYEDHQKNLWIGSGRGLSLMDRRTNSFTNYVVDTADHNFPGHNLVPAILESSRNELWVGSWVGGGLHLFDRKTGQFKDYLKGTSVVVIHEDADSMLWIGSESGLYSYHRNNDSFYLYSDNSLAGGIANVGNIMEDDRKNLWLTVTNGILKINSKRDETSLYAAKYGVKGYNNLIYVSGYKAPNNEFFIGDGNGYYSFFPDQLMKSGIPPQVNITALRLADRVIMPSQTGPLFQDLNDTKEIRLSYNQNVFSFDFEAIDFHDPESNRHIYMLENYDLSWRQSGSERKAFYFNIPPGEYVFKVKAANSSGVWAEKDIRIIITPPWWRTWWAYTLYAICFLIVAFFANRFIRNRIIEKEKIKNREKELAHAKEIEKAYHELKVTQTQLIQSEKMASLGELTAGIAHEIQNPLNFVNNFSEVSNELVDEMVAEADKGNTAEVKSLAVDVKQNLEKILHHGKRADAIVKGMLQHSRSSTGAKEPTDINALADEYLRLSYHGLRAKDKNFNASIKTDFDPAIGKINIIPQDIGRVLLNLYNNAFYAASPPSKGGISESASNKNPTVWVSTKKVGDKILITVRDNGPGIPKDIIDKIFQPFFTTKPTGQGTGLGLSLSYDIVKAHGGDLKVESEENKGSEFIIKLPV